MSSKIFIIIIFAAFLNALWNVLIKNAEDKRSMSILIVAFAGFISAFFLFILPPPNQISWPYIAGSAIIQSVYYTLIATVYKHGDMVLSFPIMRGLAPIIIMVAGFLIIDEKINLIEIYGILLIGLGVFFLKNNCPNQSEGNLKTIVLAIIIAFIIAAFTIIDGIGVRLSGSSISYTLWIYLLSGSTLLLWQLILRPAELYKHFSTNKILISIGGIGTLASYTLALWAMTLVPIAKIAALRETSILFAVALAAIFLKEKISRKSLLAATMITLGAVLFRIN